MIELTFLNEDALSLFAQDFALALKAGDCIALEGDLGAGKSTFARAVIRAAYGDFDKKIEVPSPTFTLVQLYDSAPAIAHFDLYRIADADELDELGLDAALENGAALIEWPSRAADALPADLILIRIIETHEDPDVRLMSIEGNEDFLARLKRSMVIRAFLGESGFGQTDRHAFPGDASARNYEFIHHKAGEAPLILMDAPKLPQEQALYDGLTYKQIVHLSEEVSAFVAVSEMLRHEGFATPIIYAQDLPKGLLLIENLGEGKIVTDDNIPIRDRYLASVEVLADIHGKNWKSRWELPDGQTHIVPRYDARAMRTGLSLLPDWWGKENGLSEALRDELYLLWEPIFQRFQSGYDDLIIRDFHSPNIIWRGDKTGNDRIGIIDHQDALIGPGAYDVAALMQDARTIVAPELQAEILDTYCARRREQSGFNESQSRLDVATLGAFRSSRLLGLWVRLDVRDGKHRFRNYEAPTRAYLAQSLAHPDLAELRAWYVKAGVIDA
ncbi:tRNA (adenosine(37)-N6)-threonylcarbamoyltransferase complex ATPase subunit type 1 TsaE [Ahrensia kielensis]|uniref:tRNA threonylcarbamoyladenosine biosynthesis protein TsaE n=1 Tax=Ahrensia kielensis TaxID=76980 RepID=A0ABU9T771_9HYPH